MPFGCVAEFSDGVCAPEGKFRFTLVDGTVKSNLLKFKVYSGCEFYSSMDTWSVIIFKLGFGGFRREVNVELSSIKPLSEDAKFLSIGLICR